MRLAFRVGDRRGSSKYGQNAKDLWSRISAPLYTLYTGRLLAQIQRGPLPRHVAIILDGNRRFARLYGLEKAAMGHKLGAEKVDELLEWTDELAIPVVTLWALSVNNLDRRQEELGELIEVIQTKLIDLSESQATRRRPRSIHAVGRLDLLPASMRKVINNAETHTEDKGPLRLNIAIGYDGREEITDAVRRLLLDRAKQDMSLSDVANSLSSEDIAKRLYRNSDPEPDLIIRSSGELRLSGFLLWQGAYSELYFCDTMWPLFRKVDFLRAIRSYQQRELRFGI